MTIENARSAHRHGRMWERQTRDNYIPLTREDYRFLLRVAVGIVAAVGLIAWAVVAL